MTWYALAPSRDKEGVVQIEAPSFLDAKEIAEKWLGITGIGFHSIGVGVSYHGSNIDRYYPHGVTVQQIRLQVWRTLYNRRNELQRKMSGWTA